MAKKKLYSVHKPLAQRRNLDVYKCAIYYENISSCATNGKTLQMATTTTLQTSDHLNELKKEFEHGTLTRC